MKRYFISVGSSASSGVLGLINKLRDENIFGRYNDVYIAIDSDTSYSSEFNKFEALQKSTGRVRALRLKYTDQDIAVAPKFKSTWIWPRVPTNGVGGERDKAEKARNWQSELRTAVFSNLQEKDIVVLVGTAFGGTATGLYWSIAEFLADELSRKIEAMPQVNFDTVVLAGFVLLPDTTVNPQYFIGENICDFFRELQVTHWRRRLQQYYSVVSSEKGVTQDAVGFKVPVYCHADAMNTSQIPLYPGVAGTGKRANQGVGDSYLPMSTLYFVPTPEGSRRHERAQILLAEQMFAVFYLGVQREFRAMAVDRFAKTCGGRLDVEDPSFGGLELLVYKSGRSLSLRKWFNREITEACAAFLEDVSKPIIRDNILACFKEHFYQDSACMERVNLTALREAKDRVLVDGRFDEFIANLPEYVENVVRDTSGFPSAGRRDFNAFMTALLLSPDIKRWGLEINFRTISDAYEQFCENHIRQAGAIDDSKKRLITSVQTASKKFRQRLSAPQARALNKMDSVRKEILDGFSKAFDKALEDLVSATRAKKTDIISSSEFSRDLREFHQRVQRIDGVIKDDTVGKTAYPHVVEGVAIETFRLSPDWGWGGEPFMSILLNAAVELNDASRDVYIEEKRIESVIELNRLLEDPRQSHIDPFGNTSVNIELQDATGRHPEPFSHAFRLQTIDDPNRSPHSSHFAIAPIGSVPKSCPITCDYVKNTLQLGLTFPDLPLGQPFFDNTGSAVRHLSQANYATARLLQEGCIDNNTVRIQGIWLGTERANFSLQDVLTRVYPREDVRNDWEGNAYRLTGGAVAARRLMSLREMIILGVVLQATEAKAQAIWQGGMPEKMNIALEFKGMDGDARKSFGLFNLVSVGFTANGVDSIKLNSISCDLMSLLFDWIRDTGGVTGFSSLYAAVVKPLDIFDDLEHRILTRGRLRIEKTETDIIETLGRILRQSLNVTLTKDERA